MSNFVSVLAKYKLPHNVNRKRQYYTPWQLEEAPHFGQAAHACISFLDVRLIINDAIDSSNANKHTTVEPRLLVLTRWIQSFCSSVQKYHNATDRGPKF